MTKGYRTMVAEAEAEVKTLNVAELRTMQADPDLRLIDIRDLRELDRDGMIEGATHCPRGMLEFWIDPESPYHKEIFTQDKRFVFFCAGGMRSALAAKTAKDMGLEPVAHIEGGFGKWKEEGGPVEEVPAKG